MADRLFAELAGLRGEVAAVRRMLEEREAPTLTIERACAWLGCGRGMLFRFIAHGKIQKAPRTGRRTMLVKRSVLDFLERPGDPPPRPGNRAGRDERKAFEQIYGARPKPLSKRAAKRQAQNESDAIRAIKNPRLVE